MFCFVTLLGTIPAISIAADTQIFSGWATFVLIKPRFGSPEAACKAEPALNYVFDPNIYSAWYDFTWALPNLTDPNYRDCYFQITPVPDSPPYNVPRAFFSVFPYYDDATVAKNAGMPLPCTTPTTKNPIIIGTGNKFFDERDYSGSGPQPLTLRRYYNSATSVATNIGPSWRHSYDRQILLDPRVDILLATVRRPDGKAYSFTLTNGIWLPDADISDKLVQLPNTTGWQYTSLNDQVELYDANGRLQSITNRIGLTQTLIYSDGTNGLISGNGGYIVDSNGNATTTVLPGGLLIRISDPSNRSLNFGYNAPLRIVKMIDPSGGNYLFGYDANNNLTFVTYPDGSKRIYWYNEQANTSGTNLPNALTGITDENGTRFANYRYDSKGRANDEDHGGSVDHYNLAYTTDSAGNPVSTTVTDPLNTQFTYNFQTILGVVRSTGRSQPGGSGCAASTSAMTYDANGNIASKDDFNGSRTCYASDLSRNLEISRVEGLVNTQSCATVTPAASILPAGSRKVSTTWHPDWRLQTHIAEPGKMTTSVYNGQPDPFNGNTVASCAPHTAVLPDGKPIAVLCRQVEQATTDTNGGLGFTAVLQVGVANREQKWTYNQYGQILTHDGPRTDVSDVTTYIYYTDTSFTGVGSDAVGHTLGDLQSMTNAVGTVTQYTQYNKHGQLLQSIDPNGVVTAYTYDLRKRLLSTAVGGQTTSYTYDPVGQLTRITRSDASWIGYEYDAAHRQTAVLDNRGSRIEYTLDNDGNKIAEQVKDPGGALRRSLARSIDALGRVQQITGKE